MNYDQFRNLSCYEEFEIQCDLIGVSKIDALRRFGHRIYSYYFFVSEDGIFNWVDLNGNHIENPYVLKTIKKEYIQKNITKCVIPDSVISIDDCAFSYYETLKELTIPDSVTNIGNCAFYCCTSLKEITIPDSVKRIGNYAFANCIALTEISIPDSVICIGDNSFFACKALTEISIPDSVTSIGKCAFDCCVSLQKITIPNSVTSIGKCAIKNCKSLKEVIFKGKTLDEVKRMKNYPFGIEDECIIHISH